MSDNLNSEINLRPLWDALLAVYEVFADICERHGLRYCADAGTALGAVRHKGFIPWDDDIDIQMPRPDYEKFIEIAKRELPKGYAWLDKNNCATYHQGFGKVIVTDEQVIDRVAAESRLKLSQGVFIDIFPLDGYPDAWYARKWRRVQNYLVDFRVKYNRGWSGNPTLKGKIAYLLGMLLLPFNYRIPTERARVEFYERRAKGYPFGSTQKCVSIGISQYFDDKPYDFCFFGVPKKVPFDRVKMPIQGDSHGYLKAKFGDYLQLPPEDKRKPGHDTGDYEPWRLGWKSHTTD